jgi:Domain of unknown function (DUF4166)
MISIYRRALGADFARLHPQIQRRFGFSSDDGVASIGRGVMEEVWRGRAFTVPFLVLGTWRRIMFPERALDVPFTIENYAYRDGFGRETVTWTRTFELPRRSRRFDATMIWSEERGCIVDYLGTHQHLAVDLHASVDEKGGIRFRSGEQRFYERRVGFRFPPLFSGIAEVREWYEDADERFRIEVAVANARFGRLFGYCGWFDAEERPCDDVPAHVKPVREERRE